MRGARTRDADAAQVQNNVHRSALPAEWRGPTIAGMVVRYANHYGRSP